MGKICEVAKAFEDEVADGLVMGAASAEIGRTLYPSSKTSDLGETYFTQRLLVMISQLRLNVVSILFPSEGYTGADVEIYVLLKYGGWAGLKLQAKRASFKKSGYSFRELAHPKRRGTQNGMLFQSSLEEAMVPLYLYYIPRDLVNQLKPVMNVSGAMIGSAWNANQHIEARDFSALRILRRNTMPLNQILCPLDREDREFVVGVENLFMDHIHDFAFEDISKDDPNLDEMYPELIEIDDLASEQSEWQNEMFRVARYLPPELEKWFKSGLFSGFQPIEPHCGAVVIDRTVFTN